jgi:predicted nucleic acid-binding protein
MELIIDANVLISALVMTRGFTYDLIFREDIKLFAPEYLLEEFQEHKKEIIVKSGLSEEDLQLFLSLISARINLIEKQEFEEFIGKAKEITPDQDDTEYFALALKLNCPIWSNDKKLKQQNKIKVYSTDELIKIIQRD